jgi:hypothetical protein
MQATHDKKNAFNGHSGVSGLRLGLGYLLKTGLKGGHLPAKSMQKKNLPASQRKKKKNKTKHMGVVPRAKGGGEGERVGVKGKG